MGISEKLIEHVSSRETYGHYTYKCGYCGHIVSGRVPLQYLSTGGDPKMKVLICTSCENGSVWNLGFGINPGKRIGEDIKGLPDLINDAYQEARDCFSLSAFTSCELMCRKILMNIAVNKGAEEGQSFVSYLDYLEEKEYISTPIKKWANSIRENGNTSTHEIAPPDEERAKNTFNFTMQLLRIIYEMPYIAETSSSSEQV